MSEARTIRLDLEYDGTHFVGWQIQKRGRSVQGELARALQQFLGENAVPVGSGRTDAGTHALGQVAHFHTASSHPPERMVRALNSLLPPDISVSAASQVAADFHARYSARSKRYRYRIATAKTALERDRVWTLSGGLDYDAMAVATTALEGTLDFRAFCNHHPVPASFSCTVLQSGWERAGAELRFEIEANRFLRHMVRIIVGTLAEVGRGRRPADLSPLLAPAVGAHSAPDRNLAGPTAPARGLCLLSVDYGD